MLRFRLTSLVLLLAGLVFMASPVLAQDVSPSTLTISTANPSMVVGIGETVTLSMDVHSPTSQSVNLDVADLSKDWTAEFRGGGRIIRSVYAAQGTDAKVDLRVTLPTTAKAGTYQFNIVAQAGAEKTQFPLEFIVKEKAPARLTFETDYATIRGGPDEAFSFSVYLKNDGDWAWR